MFDTMLLYDLLLLAIMFALLRLIAVCNEFVQTVAQMLQVTIICNLSANSSLILVMNYNIWEIATSPILS